ncbi:SDR family NAD(P)-dependent oxidoreductase [Streptantibioticus rubrisoli]|uniref:SDR family NAD(P)-dependent oxidoreductase n=1 Tax=Streptantibioticus rubrisoli TaxID=1387313 RepID=A0ABT1P639_9ACTN|nr:SDR family NAD(P)-dependent oxidoreductase [Streptantibioticus rubrisoli]MCQ4040840.1 SDR family NAD(P)-dependent oxidoreductase [Streptantibioticus rubrisoli]
MPTTNRLAGTVALVTGASSGIGEATARALAAEGAAVSLVARRQDRLEQVACGIRELGGTALVRTADLTEEEQAHAAVDHSVAALGGLDILVNNAGLMLLGPFEEATSDQWRRMVRINLMGLMYTTQAALPHLVRAAADGTRQVADLVNVSAVAGRRTRAGRAVYSSTKFGVGALTEGLRQELHDRHVRVCAIEPGSTVTELRTHNPPHVRARLDARRLRRLDADDVAEAVVFAVTRPRHASVSELLIRPTEQP